MMRDTFWQRLWRGVRRVWSRPDWDHLTGSDWPDRVMALPVTDRFSAKQGRSTGRLLLKGTEGRLAVYLKRHYRLKRWRGLLATLWPGHGWSPAAREARNLEWAREAGVPVPAVVAAGEFIGPRGRLQSFLAVEELADMLPLHEAIPLAARQLDPETFARWKRSLLAEMARLVRLLHDRHWFHKDLYLCHFYITDGDTARLPDDWQGRVHLIDLHRLSRHRWTWRFWQTKDLAQLLYSSEVPGVTARDRLRFWRLYLGQGRKTFLGRLAGWLIRLRWRRYRQHNERRRRRARRFAPSSPVPRPEADTRAGAA
jgi:Lipopolysaccharide kinase (Kdo/WaaP) family